MDELSWFLSILRAKDYLPVARLIPGFPQDLRNPVGLKKQVEEALMRGFTRLGGRRSKLPQMNLRELYNKIGSDHVEKYPHLASESVEDLVLKLQIEPKIMPYQQVCVLYTMFADQFDELLPKLLSTEIKADSPLEVLSGAEPVLHRLGKLLRGETFDDLIPAIHNDLQETSDITVCKDEDALFMELRKVDKNARNPLLFTFLTNNDNHKKPEYQFLCEYVVQEYREQKYTDLEKECTQQKATNEAQARDIQRLKNRIRVLEAFEKEVASQRKQLEEYISQHEVATTAYQEATNQMEQMKLDYEAAIKWRDDLQNFIKEIKPQDRHYLIVTEDPNGIVASVLSIEGVSKKALTKIRTQNTWNQRFKDAGFFVIRNNFQSTDDWIQFTEHLNRFGVEYREVTGYEEMGHLAQIINYLLEEK